MFRSLGFFFVFRFVDWGYVLLNFFSRFKKRGIESYF